MNVGDDIISQRKADERAREVFRNEDDFKSRFVSNSHLFASCFFSDEDVQKAGKDEVKREGDAVKFVLSLFSFLCCCCDFLRLENVFCCKRVLLSCSLDSRHEMHSHHVSNVLCYKKTRDLFFISYG
jgi:hypothetical protein